MAQMRLEEEMQVPIVVRTPEGGAVKRDPTQELNRTSAEPPRTAGRRPLRVFVSYSREDKRAEQLFRKNLMVLESDGYVTFWADPNIQADMEWRPEIDRELEAMDIFIGLVTTNFLASKFIQRVELRHALKRRTQNDVALWLVLVDDRRIGNTVLGDYQLLKPGGKAVTEHRSMRAGFDLVEKQIHELIVRPLERATGARRYGHGKTRGGSPRRKNRANWEMRAGEKKWRRHCHRRIFFLLVPKVSEALLERDRTRSKREIRLFLGLKLRKGGTPFRAGLTGIASTRDKCAPRTSANSRHRLFALIPQGNEQVGPTPFIIPNPPPGDSPLPSRGHSLILSPIL